MQSGMIGASRGLAEARYLLGRWSGVQMGSELGAIELGLDIFTIQFKEETQGAQF